MPQHDREGMMPTESELTDLATSKSGPATNVQRVEIDLRKPQLSLQGGCVDAYKIRPSTILKSKDKQLLRLENMLIRQFAAKDYDEAKFTVN